jgi:uncharacterized protein YlxW (UPF0749 family)
VEHCRRCYPHAMLELTTQDVRRIVREGTKGMAASIAATAAKAATIESDVVVLKTDVQDVKSGVDTLLQNVDKVLKNTENETHERQTADAQLQRRVEALERGSTSRRS